MMKTFAVVFALCISCSAYAGEQYLGKIVSSAGADTTNATTAAPFVIPTGALISMQCNATAYLITDDLVAVDTDRGVHVAAAQFFITSTSNYSTIVISSTVSAVARVAGPSAVTCSVWVRRGNE